MGGGDGCTTLWRYLMILNYTVKKVTMANCVMCVSPQWKQNEAKTKRQFPYQFLAVCASSPSRRPSGRGAVIYSMVGVTTCFWHGHYAKDQGEAGLGVSVLQGESSPRQCGFCIRNAWLTSLHHGNQKGNISGPEVGWIRNPPGSLN